MPGLTDHIAERLGRARVLPAVTIERVEDAVPVARALAAGGLDVIEILMRTPAAAEAIYRIRREAGEVIVGAGTVRSKAMAADAAEAGAAFLVSPGGTPTLCEAAEATGLPLLPGAATATEAMLLLERGYRIQKFFPAEALGGAAAMKALAGPLPEIMFCTTSGVHAGNAASYLARPNVLCVGGSWVAPADRIVAQDWAGIIELARAASRLPRGQAGGP